jgi:hypothetical protein
VRAYAVTKRGPAVNGEYLEIERIARAAEDKEYKALEMLWTALSDGGRHHLQARANNTLRSSEVRARARQRLLTKTGWSIREPSSLILELPTVADLGDPKRQSWACDMIFRLCVVGRGIDHRWSGSESTDNRSLDPTALRLHAPQQIKKELPRQAERELLLALAVC